MSVEEKWSEFRIQLQAAGLLAAYMYAALSDQAGVTEIL